MICMIVQIIFFEMLKFITLTIVFHISYQSAIMSEINLSITLHCFNTETLYSIIITMININAEFIFFSLQKLIAITIVILCQCAIMSVITLNIT